MADAFISFQRLPYDDSAWCVRVSASNGSFSGMQDFYTCPEELDALGQHLCKFPQTVEDEARFELGSLTGNSAYFVLIRAFLFDAIGHAAMQFSVSNNAASPYTAQTNFYIRTEVAAINTCGQSLRSWIIDSNRILLWQPYSF